MKTLWQDARYGLRMLLKKPGFTLTAVITLALGIGATSTIFSFVNGILLRPLPYQDSERLILLDETAAKRGIASMGVSFPNFLDWREQNRVFTGVAAYGESSYTLTGSGEPEELSGASISYNAFEVLGVAPILGRTFTADEDRPENDLVVILGHGLWVRGFGARPEIIGQKITLNNRSRTVIGVMPPDFKFPEVADLWVPLALDTRRWTRNDHGLSAIARLKAGVTLEQAQSDITAVARRIEEQNPVTNEGMGVNLIPLREGLVGDYRKALLILMGVVGLVLLIACANVANLLLARASARALRDPVRRIRRSGVGAGFSGHLRRDVLLSLRTHARAGHSAGARGAAARRGEADRRSGNGAGSDRRRHRSGCRAGVDAVDADPAVRGECDRPAHVRRSGGVADGYSAAGLLSACAAGDEGGSDDRAQVRVTMCAK
ncbi:MAG: ABC transporter permease [Blastocatellia bacterium]